MLAARGTVDAGSLARKANLDDLGLNPTAAQVSRDFAQWQAERDLAEQPEGHALKIRYNEQGRRLKDLLAEFRDAQGGSAGDAVETGSNVQQALRAKSAEMQGDLSHQYRAIAGRAGMDAGSVVRPNGIRAALGDARPYLDAGLAPRAQAVGGVLDRMLDGAGTGAAAAAL